MKEYVKTLTIAGSDSGGGAGIQADLKTFAALGCYGMSAITALTAQNTCEVVAIQPISADFVQQQIRAVISDIGTNAIKIGMLHNESIIKVVAKELHSLTNIPIILDPVMVATTGGVLLEKAAITSLKQELLPMASIITPNIPEAELLVENKLKTSKEIEKAAKTLCIGNLRAVLIKGGHLNTSLASDCLYLKKEDKIYWLNAPRINTKNTHGTGCTLSAAIAANLAKKFDILTAVKEAKNYLSAAIKTGSSYKIGNGHGPVYHQITSYENSP